MASLPKLSRQNPLSSDSKLEDLPHHLIELILKHLSLANLIRASVVCRSWKYVIEFYMSFRQFPWLMFHDNTQGIQNFFSIQDGKIYKIDLDPQHQDWHRNSRRGWHRYSSKGWLVMRDESRRIFLMNPLTHFKIQLPPPLQQKNRPAPNSIRKMVLSSQPASDNTQGNYNCMVALLDCDDFLFFCNLGDKSWRVFDEKNDKQRNYRFSNIFFCKQQLFALVRDSGTTMVFYSHPRIKIAPYGIAPPKDCHPEIGCKRYVTEFNGDLFMVVKRTWKPLTPEIARKCPTARTRPFSTMRENREFDTIILAQGIWFNLFKLDGNNSQWIPIESMHDKILFLDSRESIILSAYDFPMLQGNCIYFTHQNFSGKWIETFPCNWTPLMNSELMVFHLEDDRIETCLKFDAFLFPSWFFPSRS